VHILHRYSGKKTTRLETAPPQVSKGVALMGVSFSALIALTLLPVLLRKRLPKKGLS
jgi:hypothetical protein